MERGSSVVERRTRNQVSPGSNPHGINAPVDPCINEYLSIDSGGNVSDLVLARNCFIDMARMLPGEAENGVGLNRSVREGNKCEAL